MGALTGSAAGVKARGCARPLRGVLIAVGALATRRMSWSLQAGSVRRVAQA